MSDVLSALLAAGAVPSTALPPTSRYASVGTVTHHPAGAAVPISFLRRRLVPQPDRFAVLHEHTCAEGDRRDLVAARNLGDPELWWRVADANGVIDPATMTQPPGRRLRITLEADVPGAPDA